MKSWISNLSFKLIFVIDGWGIYRNIVLRWMSVEFTDDKTALAQIMVWCVRQQAITRANDDLDPYCYTVSLGDNELRWGHDFLCPNIFIYSIGLYWGLAIHLTHIIYGCFNGIRVITCSTNEVTHYSDVIMGSIASQITSITILYSSVYSGAAQRKHQSSASLVFVWGIHRRPVNSPHKEPVTRKMFPFDNIIMPWEIWVRM